MTKGWWQNDLWAKTKKVPVVLESEKLSLIRKLSRKILEKKKKKELIMGLLGSL